VYFFADVRKGFNDIVFLGDVFIDGKFLVFIENSHSNINQSFLRPREKPIDCATADKGGELPASNPEGIADGAHRENDMQSLPDSFNKGAIDSLRGFVAFEQGVKRTSHIYNIFSLVDLPNVGYFS
jgi:hypothetical protein